MMRDGSLSRLASAGALAMAWLVSPPPASAQIPTVQPDGTLSEPAAPPPEVPPPPIIVTPPGQAVPAPDSPGRAGSYYHSEDVGLAVEPDNQTGGPTTPGQVPAVHVVRTGDTLWDLCWAYFNNPWEWPRVWSYNPEITNPHWIYPGDQVRLRAAGAPAAEADNKPPPAPAPAPAQPVAEGVYELRQLAFLATEQLSTGISIDGSPEEKIMLATGDEVYLVYPDGKPPRLGQHYAVYLERERVLHPTRGEEVGAYVRVVGELEVISVVRDKRARAVITDSVDVIERGMAVGPVERQFRNIEPTPAETDLEGIIVAEISAEELIGARQVVFIDRGSDDRVRVGNRLHAIRRGDGYDAIMEPAVGKNDARYPARSIGELLVVQTGRRTSVAVVVRADKELGVGDRVLLSRARNPRR